MVRETWDLARVQYHESRTTYHAKDSALLTMSLSLSLALSLSLFLTACQQSPPQTGHQVLATAVRALLDKSYAGIDYLQYRDQLRVVEAVAIQQHDAIPPHLLSQTEEILTCLRTAEEILRWQAEHNSTQAVNTKLVATWVARHPFLRAAIGAKTNNAFDIGTAVILLWDKTNTILPNFQVKSKPL